jgi:hypothetical protein
VLFFIKIQRKDKILVAKWDSIKRHAIFKKNFNSKWFMDPKCGHAKNEIVYAKISIATIL